MLCTVTWKKFTWLLLTANTLTIWKMERLYHRSIIVSQDEFAVRWLTNQQNVYMMMMGIVVISMFFTGFRIQTRGGSLVIFFHKVWWEQFTWLTNHECDREDDRLWSPTNEPSLIKLIQTRIKVNLQKEQKQKQKKNLGASIN